VIPKFSELFLA